ncbi:MAG: Uma2 family endonuclease [bacterium]|nr:Uma2 family endonuclease [bacterium]
MLTQTQRVTVDEFESFLTLPENHERLFELIDGEIIEKVPTQQHGFIVAWIASLLINFVVPRHLGRVGVEIRHRMAGETHNARIPDIAYYAQAPDPVIKSGTVPYMPDLAIEVKSPDDALKAMREKAKYYLANGCKRVWLVLPDQRLVEVVTLMDETILTADELLDGGDVLPGFSITVAELFRVAE